MTLEPDRGHDRVDCGFTLIELLVVVSIMSVLLAFAPLLSSSVSGARFRTGVTSVVATLRAIHRQSERNGKPIMVSFKPQTFFWHSDRANSEFRLPSGVDRMELSAEQIGPDGETAIYFFPDGSATGARLVLLGGRQRATVWIDWVSGYVHADQ